MVFPARGRKNNQVIYRICYWYSPRGDGKITRLSIVSVTGIPREGTENIRCQVIYRTDSGYSPRGDGKYFNSGLFVCDKIVFPARGRQNLPRNIR